MDTIHSARTDLAIAGQKVAGLDYRVLVATVQAWQISTATARAQGRFGGNDLPYDTGKPSALTRILLGG